MLWSTWVVFLVVFSPSIFPTCFFLFQAVTSKERTDLQYDAKMFLSRAGSNLLRAPGKLLVWEPLFCKTTGELGSSNSLKWPLINHGSATLPKKIFFFMGKRFMFTFNGSWKISQISFKTSHWGRKNKNRIQRPFEQKICKGGGVGVKYIIIIVCAAVWIVAEKYKLKYQGIPGDTLFIIWVRK